MKKHLVSTPPSWSSAHVDQLDVLPVPGVGVGEFGRRGEGSIQALCAELMGLLVVVVDSTRSLHSTHCLSFSQSCNWYDFTVLLVLYMFLSTLVGG